MPAASDAGTIANGGDAGRVDRRDLLVVVAGASKREGEIEKGAGIGGLRSIEERGTESPDDRWVFFGGGCQSIQQRERDSEWGFFRSERMRERLRGR